MIIKVSRFEKNKIWQTCKGRAELRRENEEQDRKEVTGVGEAGHRLVFYHRWKNLDKFLHLVLRCKNLASTNSTRDMHLNHYTATVLSAAPISRAQQAPATFICIKPFSKLQSISFACLTWLFCYFVQIA